ncbi:MAG TPA: PAS domain S-box protein, partial [Chryseosolibacter sp.]|nr:PAS domain S-box protein [Chryseosolibacter sp.]
AHIFQKKQGSGARAYPVPESVPHLRFDEAEKTLARQQRATTERITHSELHQRLLEEYAPPSIVVDEHYEIVHLSDRAGRYLHVAGGEPSQNLLKLIRPELRLDLRSALYQATQRRAAVEARGLKLSIDEAVETINILIRPVLHTGDVTRGFLLVLFERADNVDGQTDVVISSDEPVAKHLEEELIRLKSQLRVSNEQHEFNAEELKASNEELQAMNEELRSAAEELETSKEELQSINEELRTVNQELKVKVEETTLASNNLQNVINSVDIGTIFLDRGLRVAFFTPAARTLFNLIPSDLGRPLSDLTGHLVYDHLTSDAESVLEKLHPVEREVRTNDGRVFMMRVLPYRTAEDRINGVVITFIDVTSLKRTQDALKASEERLRLVLEGAKDYAIFTIDTDRRITSWNKGAEAVMGYSEKEIMGQLGDIIFVPEDRAREHPVMEVSKARQFGVAENERWHLRKDGSRFYGSGTVRPLEDSTGKITGFVKVMRDLTEQKRAADALVQSEERFRAMVSQTNAGLLHTDLNGIITLVNSKLCDILGYSERELLGKSIWELTFADDRETNRQIFDSLRTKMIPSEAEKRLLHKDGFPIWVSESLSAIRNERGEAESAVAVILDISSRKELEEQKDEFIGIASHELKTPVTSIKAYTELLQERLEKTGHEENVMLINKLGSQVDRLVELIRNLLGTTRIAEGKMVLNLETLDLRELVKEQIEEFKRFSNKHKFVLKSSDVRPVDADRERITQVLTNLLSNAVKYSPDGGKVGVTIEEEDNEVKVTIADKGVGIADDAKDRIFDRFFRASTATNETQPGMGLGLYITAGIVHRHGGTISFESKIGKGSKFWFILPI